MKISKRDMQLLILLGFVSLVAAYYWFMFMPQTEKLKVLQDEQALINTQRSDIDRLLSIAPTLDSDIEAVTTKLLKASQRYYGSMLQENLVMTINELAEGTSLMVKGINFTAASEPLLDVVTSVKASLLPTDIATGTVTSTATPVDPNIATPVDPNAPVTQLNTITATIQYEGQYVDLEAFILNVYKYHKQMVIQSIRITSDTAGVLTGTITIDFYGMPKIGLIKEELESYFATLSKRPVVSDVFLPYETFVTPIPEVSELIDMSEDLNIDETETDIVEEKQPSELISSFEDFGYFFIGDKPSIVGSASRTDIRTDGNFGLKLKYNFVEQRKVNTASVVFDQSPIVVTQPGGTLVISAYSEAHLKHRIAAELVDSVGKSYDVTFAMELTPTGWQEIEATLPKEINYPFVVKRIFFEGTGFDQQLVAEVILDELKLLLPNLGGDQ